MRPIRLGRPSPAQIIAAAQVMSVDVAYYSNSRAITVWAEGDDAPAESLDEAAGRQHLRFARWDGEAWSEPADLTPPGSADGNVALAPCRAGSSIRCGLEGSVAAVWVRERVGDLSQRRFSVMYSVYQARNNTWSTPAPINPRAIDASYDPTQLQPTVTYLDGRPAVFWVENDARVPSSIVSRRLHYRIVGLGDPQVASTLPQGISWPSVAMSGDSQLMLSFTVATDPQAFVGNQNAVYGARANCSGGACSFVAHQLRDPRGRQIRGEAPRVQMTNDGKAQVVFRGLGFGPDASGEHFHSDDPVGIQTGLGAAVKVQLDPNALSGNVSLTNIGQGALDFYRPLAQFDTRGGGTLVIGSRRASSVEPLLKAARDYPRGVRGKVVPTMIEDELMLMALPDAPDLALRLVEHPEANVQPGGTVRIELELGNGGADFIVDPAAPTRLAAAWDGDPGVSATVISQNVVNLATNQTRTITLDVPMPADAQPDQLRWLHLALEGGITESDRDGRDNRLRVLIGGLPMPDNLRPVTRVGGEVVLLEWDAVEDERVAGYRVYALDAEGEPVAIGFTPVNGFADLTLAPGFNRTYMVTSLSASGSESAFSDAAVAALPMTDALFSDSFEPDEVLP